MRFRRVLIVLLYVVPGVLLGSAAVLWGLSLRPPQHRIPSWAEAWSEPKQPKGVYKSWRSEDGYVVGETEPWPHKHPRANSYLLSNAVYEGDIQVELRVRFRNKSFPNSRYLACYLCYDPEKGDGYWLATGHAVGKYPNQAYIKEVHGHDWETKARGPLEIVPNRDYTVVFRRSGDRLAVIVDGKTVVTWTSDEFHRGRVQLRLHNTEVEIHKLAVRGTIASSASGASLTNATRPTITATTSSSKARITSQN
jgi:hypothetical protein